MPASMPASMPLSRLGLQRSEWQFSLWPPVPPLLSLHPAQFLLCPELLPAAGNCEDCALCVPCWKPCAQLIPCQEPPPTSLLQRGCLAGLLGEALRPPPPVSGAVSPALCHHLFIHLSTRRLILLASLYLNDYNKLHVLKRRLLQARRRRLPRWPAHSASGYWRSFKGAQGRVTVAFLGDEANGRGRGGRHRSAPATAECH